MSVKNSVNSPCRPNKLNMALLSALAVAASGPAQAQITELVVTATKRAESTQDIPVSVAALQGDDLDQLRISALDDYARYLPNVVTMGTGPGQSEIYIRGAATEQSKISVSSVQGSFPAVALYVDEQPVSFGGRNVDYYAADLQRIEVLPGPQGTLFGASSQSGTVRLITNKPVIGEFQAGVKADIGTTRGGDVSHSQQVYVNAPVTDNLALRLVAYHDRQGGWIDNIPNDVANGGFAPNVAVLNRNDISRAPIHPDSPFEAADNSALVEDDFNDAIYAGGRLSLAYEANSDWGLLIQHTQQSLDTDGVFAYDPNLDGKSSVNRFTKDSNEDDFGLTALNLKGRMGALDFIYAVGYLNRDVDAFVDHTDYTSGGGYQVYYLCAGTRDFPQNGVYSGFQGYGGTVGRSECHDPEAQYYESTQSTRLTHEFRVNTLAENRWRLTAGFFHDKQITHGIGAFEAAATRDDGDGSWPTLAMIGDAGPGANSSLTEPYEPWVSFLNDYTRRTDQMALFGQLEFDLAPGLSASFGARWYDLDFDFKGASNFSFGCKDEEDGCDSSYERGGHDAASRTSGNNVTARLRALGTGTLEALQAAGLDQCRPTAEGCRGNPFSSLNNAPADVFADLQSGALNVKGLNNDGVLNQSDVIFRASLDWRMTDDILLFATFGQGFRPPVTNRNAAQAALNPRGLAVYDGYRVPAVALTDEMENYELGLKADFLNNTLRINATGYFSDITDLQVSRFDPINVAFLFFIENVGDAEIFGFDGDFIWTPTPKLTLAGAVGFVDSELTRLNPQLEGIAVPVGSELPFTPDFSGNIRARYDFGELMDGANAYISGGLSYAGESKSGLSGSAFYVEDTLRLTHGGRGSGLKIAAEGGEFVGGNCGTYNQPRNCLNGRYVQDDYVLLDLAVGMESKDWSAEFFIDNVTDKRAQLHVDTLQYVPKVVTNRPRAFGVRFSYDYR